MLEGLKEELDKLCEKDPMALRDGASIVELHRCLAPRGRHHPGHRGVRLGQGRGRSAGAWLRTQCSLPPATAARRLRLGPSLRHLPATEAAWSDGDICDSHVLALASARKPATEEATARDEAMLVSEAQQLRFNSFIRVLAYWSQRADPTAARRTPRIKPSGEGCTCRRAFGGMWFADVVLDPISGAIVSGELSRIEGEMFDTDWAEARARLGERAGVDDLVRSAAQRRADALVEMARRSATTPADGRRPEPLCSVFVGYETLVGRICELANGTVVSLGSLVAWLDEAAPRAHRVRQSLSGHRRGHLEANLRRRLPPGRAGARPGVLPPLL